MRKLLMNETIWLKSTIRDEIQEINSLSKRGFGIKQSMGLLNTYNFG